MNSSFKVSVLLILLLSFAQSARCQYGPLERISPNSAQVLDAEIGDLDGDGDIDVAVVSRLDGKVSWYENDGTGNFPLHHDVFITTPDQRLLELIDLNNDGRLDIFVGQSEELDIDAIALINQGGGTFTDQSQSYTNILTASDPVKMEMNADGLPDLLDGLVWYKNLGNGQFAQPDTLPVPPGVNYDYYVVDVNNDDQPEVFYEVDNGLLGYLFNLGASQSFEELVLPFSFNTYSTPIQAFGDFDGDGDLDLLVKKDLPTSNFTHAWMENDGTGHFIQMNSMGVNQHFYGSDDLVAVNLDQTPKDEIVDFDYIPTVYELLDTNIISHGLVMEHGMGSSSGRFADFNGDGRVDILFQRGLTVAINDGTLGEWADIRFLDNPGHCMYFKLANMNEDGAEDIVAISNKEVLTFEVLYYLGDGEYSHKSEVASHIGHNIETLFISDYNFDGRPDIGYDEYFNTSFNTILNSWSSGYTDVHLSYSDTTISNELSIAADFDGDEDLDVITVSSYATSSGMFLYRNDGGSYPRETISASVAYSSHLQWPQTVDIEGDGDIDVVYLNRGQESLGLLPGLVVLTNDGEGQFELDKYEDPINVWYYYESFKHTDFDNDGDIDFIVGSSHGGDPNIIVYEYDFDQYVPHILPMPMQYYGYMLTTADVDNDGLTDIVGFSQSIENDGTSGLFWYRNEGGLVFDGPYFQPYVEPYLQEIDNKSVQLIKNIESLDRDGDGDDDLFLSDLGGNARGGGIYYLENLFWGSYRISGHLFFDADESGSLTNDDYPFQFLGVDISPSQSSFYTTPDGVYNAIVNPGTLTVTPDYDTALWTLTTPNPSYTFTVDSANALVTDLDFGLTPNGVQPIAELHLTEANGPCNSMGTIWVSVHNLGNTFHSGVVRVDLDSLLTPTSTYPTADSIVDNMVYFTLDSLSYFDLEQWRIVVDMPDQNQIGTLVMNRGSFLGSNGLLVGDTTSTGVLCAYDPNDKIEATGIGEEGLISNGQWLEYAIRFQNTGNAPATDVVIRDQLSNHLDQTTLTPISWSHDVLVSVEPDGDAVFSFENIMLPDSGADYAASQGFITYRIQADSNLFPGTEILNEAHIFFDNNPPVITNTTLNTLGCYGLPEQLIVWDGGRFRSPFLLPDEQQWYLNGNPIPNATGISFTPELDGIYHTEATYYGNCSISSLEFFYQGTGIEEGEQNFANIYPNPSNGSFNIQFATVPPRGCKVLITDMVGRAVYRTSQLNTGVVSVQAGELNSGVFLIHLQQEGSTQYLGKVVLVEN